MIFGQFKRSKYSLKAKYLPNSERYKYSDHYYNPKGSAPAAGQTKQQTDAQASHQKRFEEQRRTQHLQRPEVVEVQNRTSTNQTDRLTRERVEGFKQILADWPDEQFDREALVKQAKLDVHEHLLALDQMQRMLDEQSMLANAKDTEDDCGEEEDCVETDETDSVSQVEKKHEDEVDESIVSDERLSIDQKTSLTSIQADQPSEGLDDETTQSIRDRLMKQLPNEFPMRKDWREDGVVGAVLDQGTCGGCWAISAVQTIESMVGK